MKFNSFLRRLFAAVLLLAGCACFVPLAGAVDIYLTNYAGTVNWSTPGSWSSGAMPGAGDRAIITNAANPILVDVTSTNSDLLFAMPGGTAYLFPYPYNGPKLFVTNSIILSNSAVSATWSLNRGNVVVTNAAGTGLIAVAPGAAGTFTMSADEPISVIADSLIFTNGGNSLINLGGGSLTTLHGVQMGAVAIGGANPTGQLLTWNMLGGTNLFTGAVQIGVRGGNTGIVNVVGPQTVWTNTSVVQLGVQGGSATPAWGAGWTVSNGAKAYSAGSVSIGYGAAASITTNNFVVVDGNGSLLHVAGLVVGGGSTGGGAFNILTVTNGAVVINTSPSATIGALGAGQTMSSNNTIRVTGAGSRLDNTTLFVGGSGGNNRLIIDGGGAVRNGITGNLNDFLETGAGGGSNNSVLVTGGGILETPQILMYGYGDVITNQGGILQFVNRNDPQIAISNSFGAIGVVVTNGTISFRGVANAPLLGGSQLTNITFQGNNGYMLNAATNAAVTSYAFDSVANTGTATNYQSLWLTGTNSQWNSTALTIGAGGSLVVTNAVGATVASALTATGDIRVVNSSVTWQRDMAISGLYFSDPSTNVFATNATVTASGALYGSNGDMFVFYRDFINQSTNRTQFNLANATVLFSNGAGVFTHTLNLTNSGAVDKGSNWLNVTQLATNFMIGALSISLSNNVTFTGMKSGTTTNALYVGWLDLSAWNTNAGVSLTNTLSVALTLPDINLYYDASDTRNAYLQDASYALWGGGGLLIPIPEPASATLLLLGALFGGLVLGRSSRLS